MLAVADDPFGDRVLDHFASSTGRNGLAVVNVTTGTTDTVNGDQVFGTSSTIKLGVLYTLLRKIDADATLTLDTTVNIGANYGTTAGRGNLIPNSTESLRTLAQHMIDTSDNWAANRLMDFVEDRYDFNTDTWGAPGMFPIANAEFAALGLSNTRLDRYNTGGSAPSAHGLTGPGDDYRDGHDNETTPNEVVSLLQQIHENNGLLSAQSYNDYWAIMGLNPVGRLGTFYNDSVFANEDSGGWQTIIDIDSKAGSNTWPGSVGDFADDPAIGTHYQRSEAGRVQLANGEIVFYGMFVDEALNSNAPDTVLASIGYEIAFEYADASVTVTPEASELDDGRVMTVRGTSGSDVIHVIPSLSAPLTLEVSVNGILEYEGLASELDLITIFGFEGADTFQVVPSLTAVVNVHGGDPQLGDPGVPPGDVLAVNLKGVVNPIVPVGVTSGVIQSQSHFALNFFSIEQLIVSDPLELNDSIATATVLGSLPYITLRDLSIHDSGDEDFFRYTAHQTGKLIVNALFTDAIGDLDLEILDATGGSIATSNSSSDNEQLIIPVVGQQVYFIRVFGFGDDVNDYDLEIENFPTPVPTGVILDPASDTGASNSDNVTSNTTPRFFIQTDVLEFVDTNGNGVRDPDEINVLTAAQAVAGDTDGIAVEVTLVNLSTGTSITGFANPLIAMIPEVYVFTPAAPLAEGVYMVTARTRIFDDPGATGRSNASHPLWLTIDTGAGDANQISAELVLSSDSGVSNTDRVTNKISPAYHGIAPANHKVRLYVKPVGAPGNGQLVGQTVAGSDTSDVSNGPIGGIGGLPDDGLGLWEITTEPLSDGAYEVRIEIEDAAGNTTSFNVPAGADGTADIVIDTLAPNTPLLDLLTASDSGRSNVDNITRIISPEVSMTSSDVAIALANSDLQFRIFDRLNDATTEVLIFDSGIGAATQITQVLAGLAEGVHNLKLVVEDRAGNHSHDFQLQVTIDTIAPPVSFGLPGGTDGLAGASDTGVATVPDTFADRVTSDTTPTLWGHAEANSIVRVFLDLNNNGIIDLATDVFLAQTVAVPLDGNFAFPNGYWEVTSSLDLNAITGVGRDGLRQLLVTAEDVAGNPLPNGANQITAGVDSLQIFLDTQGPQITDVTIPDFPDFNLFAPKPSINGFTPLVNSLIINVRDLPNRLDQAGTDNDFLYEALIESIAENPGNYVLVGDHVGNIAIESIVWTPVAAANGQPATGTITLTFAAPLPDDRYTFRILDALVDPAGNKLDGETNAVQPSETITFPSGDGVPGGNFVARFTVDSRPEIGTYIPTTISIDINGNFVWDPASAQISNDFTNVDLTFNMQLEDPVTGSPVAGGYGVHDLVFAGKFFTDQLLVGDDAVFVIDISGSTGGNFGGDPVGDLNGDGSFNTILDAEIAAFIALNQQLIDRGLGNTAKVAIVAFDSFGNIVDMDPVAPGIQTSTFPLADTNANGILDVDEALRNLPVAGGTNFEVALQTALTAIAMAGIAPGNGNVIFLSDGFGSGNFLDEVDAIRNGQNMNLRAFGVGPGASLLQLQQIDPAAVTFSDTNELLAAFGGGGGAGGAGPARPFDQLAVFGALSQNTYRWLIDMNSDGVVNPGDGDIFTLQPRFVNGFDTASAIPVAGDFDNDPTNGDEIGLYNAGRWALDTNRNFIIDAGDTFINSNLFGHPIVGDFNGDGLDDLAVHHAVDHQFRFDLDRNGTIDAVINWGFPGVLEIPVAADMNQDGIDDIGLWVPRNSTQTPRAEAEWFFLISDDSVPHGGFNVGNLDHAFKIVPFGTDITAHFGDEQARPIVGNFDPPVTAAGSQTPTPNVVIEVPGDFNRDGIVDMADRDLWKSQFGQTGSDLAADGNADGVVDTRDFLVWRNNLGKTTEDFAAAQVVSTPGDYNSDGIVDMADHDVWKSQFGMTGTLAADGNGDGKVDIRDFMVWRNNLSVASSEVSFGSGLVAAAELTASPVAPLASDAAHESSDAAAMGTPVVGFRPMQRSGLTPLSAELPPAAVDALFAEDFDDLLLYGTQMLDEREQSDLGDLFDLFEEEDAVDEAELPVTL